MRPNAMGFVSGCMFCWVALALSGCSSTDPVSARRDMDARAAPDAGPSPLLGAGAPSEPSAKAEAGAFKPAGGPCDSPPVTQTLRQYGIELLPISRAKGLWLDGARKSVMDVSDPAAPHVRGKVNAGAVTDPDAGIAAAGELTMTSLIEQRVVAAVRGDPYRSAADGLPDDLLVIGFDDPDAPAVLQRVDIPGDVALVSVMAPADGAAARVYVISDEFELRCLGPTKQSYLYSYAFERDALVQKHKIALGDDLAVAERRGDYLVLIDGTYVNLVRGNAREPSLRTVSLRQDAPMISERAPAPFVGTMPPPIQISVQDDVLTVVSRDTKASPGLRLSRYALSDSNSPKVTSDCDSSAANNLRFDSTAKAVVLGDHVILEGSWAAIGNGPFTNELIEVNTACETRRQEQSVNLIEVPGAGVAIEVTVADPHSLRVALRDATHKEAISTATVPIPNQREIALRDNIALTDVVMFDHDGTIERGLLGVATGWGQSDERVLQLFSFSTTTITPRGTLLEATGLRIPISSGVAASKYNSAWGETFGTFKLDGDANAERSSVGELRLSPLD